MNGPRIVSTNVWRCSCFIHEVESTKSHPVFSHKPDSSSFSLSIPPSRFSLHLHQPPFSPAIQLLLSPGQQAIQKAVAEQRQAVSCQLSERERERERETFQSVNKALLLPSNQSWPPPPSNILPLFAGKTGWLWKVHSKRAIIADYYGVSPAVVIMVIWWEDLHHAKTSLDALPRFRWVCAH